ncbi:hypothetical protein [Mycoplasma sp. 4F]|uniref:hypothetical protein n=1 Tax=Mycoplasma sp. 4F TaxID=3401664 RepID=UPI003AAE1357
MGENVGYLAWNKGKNLFDIWSIFKNQNWKIKNDIDDSVEFQFNKSKSDLYEIYKEACFIIQQINLDNSLNDDDIKKYITRLQPSAFERSFVRSSFKNVLYKIDKNLKLDEFWNIDFDSENRKFINKGTWDIQHALKVVNEWRNEDLQKTRINLEKLDKMASILRAHLNVRDIKYNQKTFLEAFPTMSKSEIDYLNMNNKIENKNVEFLLEQRSKQFSKSEAVVKDLKAKKVDALLELTYQLEYNSKTDTENSYFINAIQSAIRTMIEYIVKLIVLRAIQTLEDYSIKDKAEFIKALFPSNDSKELLSDKDILDKYKAIRYDDEESRRRIIEAFLTDYESYNEKDFITKENEYLQRIFKNLLKHKGKKLVKLEYLSQTTIFKSSYEYFFNPFYSVDKFTKFIIDNYFTINLFIHKLYIKDFDSTTKLYTEMINRSNKILTEFDNMIHYMKNDKFNNLIDDINSQSIVDENKIINWTKNKITQKQ